MTWSTRASEEFPSRVEFQRDYALRVLLSCGARLQLMGYCLGPTAAPPDLFQLVTDQAGTPERLHLTTYYRLVTGTDASFAAAKVQWPPRKTFIFTSEEEETYCKSLGKVLFKKQICDTRRAGVQSARYMLTCCRTATHGESSLFAAVSGTLLKVNPADRIRTALKYLAWSLRDRFETGFKYQTALWSAVILNQEPPPQPTWMQCTLFPGQQQLYGGITKKRIRRIVDRGPSTRFPLAQALLMAKRATAPVSDRFVTAEYASHESRLKAQPPPVPYWFPREIRRTVREVFHRRFRPSSELLVPSERAHFNWSQRQHGSFGALLCRPALPEMESHVYTFGKSGLAERLDWVLACTPYLHGLPYLLAMEHRADRCVEIRGFDEWVADSVEEKLLGDQWWSGGHGHTLVDCGRRRKDLPQAPDEPEAEPSAVLEACKVRMITKGPVRQQFLGRYLQKFLWRSVMVHPTFRLIGQPLSEDDIDRFLGHVPVGSWWLSGDYKAATDYLSASCTDLCWEEICTAAEISPYWANLGHEILTEHMMMSKTTGGFYRQTNGQLMGSVVSFPILCLVNACVNRYVMEQAYAREFSLLDTGMLINGDDCLLHLPQSAYKLWQASTAAVGLKMSVGKNYFSDEFLVINSRMFAVRPQAGVWSYQLGLRLSSKVPFINPGNLHGVGRVMSSGDDETLTGFLSRCDSLLGEAPHDLREVLIDTWVYLQADRLKSISDPQQCWFLPRFCGGLGVPKPIEYGIDQVSLEARRVMRFMCSLDGQAVAHGLSLESADAPEYARMGCSKVGEWCRVLGLHSRLVDLDGRLEFLSRNDERDSFAQFTLYGAERRGTRLSHVFRKTCVKARDVAPAKGFPRYDRFLVRPKLAVPGVKFDIERVVNALEFGQLSSSELDLKLEEARLETGRRELLAELSVDLDPEPWFSFY